MLYFLSDYTEGAHPKVLEKLAETNMTSLPGYGFDPLTEEAKKKICAACGRDDLQIQFLAGGTQTNMVAISSMLSSAEAVITPASGHITEHEAGSIEYSGHKVITLPQHDGKLRAEELRAYMEAFMKNEVREHLVWPAMVYVTYPTEYGTLYTKEELRAVSEVCREFNLTLYLDGARLGYGLVSPAADMTLKDICELCDVFYIGGTKVGALCGEALVFTKNNMPKNFLAVIKQRGALLAKMRVVSAQFDALFTDGLYFEISRSAIELAQQIKRAFVGRGYELFIDSPTNQQFIIMSWDDINRLRKNAAFELWEPIDDQKAAVRFVTSWSTKKESVEALIKLI